MMEVPGDGFVSNGPAIGSRVFAGDEPGLLQFLVRAATSSPEPIEPRSGPLFGSGIQSASVQAQITTREERFHRARRQHLGQWDRSRFRQIAVSRCGQLIDLDRNSNFGIRTNRNGTANDFHGDKKRPSRASEYTWAWLAPCVDAIRPRRATLGSTWVRVDVG